MQDLSLPAFQTHSRTEVVAVYHRDLSKAKKIAQENQIPHFYDSLEQICALPEVDVVSISTPPFLHYEMAKIALQHNKHILLEKPLNLNPYETRELYQLAQQKNLIAITKSGVLRTIADFEFRFVPAWQLLAEYLQQGYKVKKIIVYKDLVTLTLKLFEYFNTFVGEINQN